MKTPIAAAAVALAASSFVVPLADAQLLGGRGARAKATAPVDPNVARTNQAPAQGTPPPNVVTGSTANSAAPAMNREVLPDGAVVPGPAVEGETVAAEPAVPLPTGALEPYMLTRQNGPFMVLAYTFRGPDAPRQALALASELRSKFQLPAYILLPRKFPNRSNIRGVPPQAPQFATRDDVGVPEIYRTLDEAAVLVGNEKTIKDSNILMHRVKKLHPACIDGSKQMWEWRKGAGLSRATMTTNPFIPAEELFPQQQDVLVARMNSEGDHNIRHCPGRYSIQIANFEGRKSLDSQNEKLFINRLMETSPLKTAAEDAERLAENLSKDEDIRKTGYEPYVFHDRFSSRVLIGSFDRIDDPNARQLRDKLVELTVPLVKRKVSTNSLIVPATQLTDVSKLKAQIQPPSPLQQARAN